MLHGRSIEKSMHEDVNKLDRRSKALLNICWQLDNSLSKRSRALLSLCGNRMIGAMSSAPPDYLPRDSI
jgi:hypothetical protein